MITTTTNTKANRRNKPPTMADRRSFFSRLRFFMVALRPSPLLLGRREQAQPRCRGFEFPLLQQGVFFRDERHIGHGELGAFLPASVKPAQPLLQSNTEPKTTAYSQQHGDNCHHPDNL